MDGVRYSINRRFYTEKDLKENVIEVARMPSVYNVPVEKLQKTGRSPKELFARCFDSAGNSLYVEEFGDIVLSNSSVKSELHQGLTSEKIASIEAIPTVLDNGKVIHIKTKEGTDVDRIIVAAPIEIGDTPYYMGVMLQRDSQNQRLYLHYVIIEKEVSNSSQADSLTNWALEENDSLSITSILQKALLVKKQYMQKTLNDADSDIRYSIVPVTDTVPALDLRTRAENVVRLADMLQNGAQNDAEYTTLERVKHNAEKIVEKYDTLAKLKAELKDVSFATGPRDTERIAKLNADIDSINRSLNALESGLSKARSAAPFRDMMQEQM